MSFRVASFIAGIVFTLAIPAAYGEDNSASPASPPSDNALDTNSSPQANPSLQAVPSVAQPDQNAAGAAAQPDQATQEFTISLTTDLAPRSADLWERIRAGFALPEIDSRLVKENEQWYASRPEYVKRMVERAKRYLFYIVKEVERRGMPTEIALLPMIESAFNPKAYSRSHASGIWQFIPSTARTYGLKQDWWYDGRRDIIAATSAALDYLQYLYGMFGDWELVLASYNWGEGAVGRALLKNQTKGLPVDFLSLRLPPETRYYVPRLIAVKNIVSNPAAYGLELEPIPNRPYFEQVATTRPMDVKLAARFAEIPLDEFIALNPAHSRPVINAGGSQTLLLPADKVGTFFANLENHDEPLVSWRAYQVKPGERGDKIASRFGISLARLKKINDIRPHRRIAPGQLLLVPASSPGTETGLSVMDGKEVETPIFSAGATHTVRKGDTLTGIARRYGISTTQLKAWNGIRSNRLIAGQKLAVRQGASNGRKVRLAKAHSRRITIAHQGSAKHHSGVNKKIYLADARRRTR